MNEYTAEKIVEEATEKQQKNDHTAAWAEAFYIGNLLFVGIFYLALWVLYFLHYKKTSATDQYHLKQALLASSITTIVFIIINSIILLTSGYTTLSGLLLLKLYYMILLPAFLIVGILAFTKAIKGVDYNYPLIGRFISPVNSSQTLLQQ